MICFKQKRINSDGTLCVVIASALESQCLHFQATAKPHLIIENK